MLPKTNKLKTLEYHIWKRFPAHRHILLACSGGLDSVVLVHALRQIQTKQKPQKLHQLQLGLGHVHHGPSRQWESHRDQALEFVEKLAAAESLPFFVVKKNEVAEELHAEADLRAHRRTSLQNLMQQSGAQCVALAHHQDDLLETRLLRLIRGTGMHGLLAMSELKGIWWRPLLQLKRADILKYAQDEGLEWMEDPSNQDEKYLRNWLRQNWLPQLEKRLSGASESLHRSLEVLAQQMPVQKATGPIWEMHQNEAVLNRCKFASLSAAEQSETIHQLLLAWTPQGVSRGRVLEAQKRLNTERKTLTFYVAGLQWQVNAERIFVKPRC